MLDHVFTDAIGALRDALEAALLERVVPDDRFAVDVQSGATTWETSYGLPGEALPTGVRADLSVDWPTESQSAFRAWLRNEEPLDDPVVHLSVVLRIQGLAELPDPARVVAVLPPASERLGRIRLERSTPTVETTFDADLVPHAHAIECGFEGEYPVREDVLDDGSILDEHFASIGGWIASMLVRLGDLRLPFRPTDR